MTFDKMATVTGFFALAATTVLGQASAATAANVTDCGLEPDGGNLENISGICELTFDSSGSYSWTLPAGIADLHALIVGGGGGAIFNNTDYGYTGAGGDTYFVDLTSSVPNDVISGTVGEGGTTNYPTPTWGQNTTLSVNGGSNYIGSGGAAGSDFAWGYCNTAFRGSSYWGENIGAGLAGAPGDGGACVGGGPGIIPDTDADAPSAFDGFTTEVGRGGGVFLNSPRSLNPGDGANVFHDSVNDQATADTTGADGAVVFRYTASAANNVADSSGSTGSLADTGNSVPVAAVTLASIGLIAAGLGATVFARRRTRS